MVTCPAMKRVIAPGEWLERSPVRLRLVELADCTEYYVKWLQDPEVNRYLETRWTEQTIDTIRDFVSGMVNSPHSYLFAIVDPDGRHVGNIKLGPIEPRHLYADVSYFLGARSAWGKGYATVAVRMATRFGFDRLGLNRVQAGFYETNVGSHRVLEKAGFTYEGRLLKKLRQTETAAWEDHLWYGAVRDTWRDPL
jgi:[ribosomal protein S5]-alanine N-acetyltransferase